MGLSGHLSVLLTFWGWRDTRTLPVMLLQAAGNLENWWQMARTTLERVSPERVTTTLSARRGRLGTQKKNRHMPLFFFPPAAASLHLASFLSSIHAENFKWHFHEINQYFYGLWKWLGMSLDTNTVIYPAPEQHFQLHFLLPLFYVVKFQLWNIML